MIEKRPPVERGDVFGVETRSQKGFGFGSHTRLIARASAASRTLNGFVANA
jgi:hypothetical protein